MSLIKEYFDKKTANSFLIRYLGCFFILYFFFPFYQGVTGVGGLFYSSFLDHFFNLVRSLTTFLTHSAKNLLEVLNYKVVENDYRTIRIGYSRGIVVNPSCLGWAVMSFWVAFVFANFGTWKHKLKWIVIGVASICALNIIRIALITLANHLNWQTITSLDHHLTFNIASYGCIFLLMFCYVRIQKKYELSNLKGRSPENAVIAV